KSTAKRVAYDEPPSAMKRILVAGSAAALLIAVALTLALWPSTPPAAEPQPAPTQTGATTPTGAAVTPPAKSPATAKPGMAMLQISVDAIADITVDGQAQPPGLSATVNVQPGVEHVVTVQRSGRPLRKLQVPA